jgi:peptidoglycan/xylan/chitin deacetylase (PgdA/CDA1 family)
MHLITLSFDDGFRASSIRTADIYERAGLRASINVVAAPEAITEESFVGEDPGYKVAPMGDFDLWNELKARGHDIQPHGHRHECFQHYPFEEAQSMIRLCLDLFRENLQGFEPEKAVFNFPYNATTPELEEWLPGIVRAFRGGRNFIKNGINPLPTAETRVLRTTGFGPANCEEHLDTCIGKLLEQDSGWLVYNTHGLDDEGWGPIGSDYLVRLLDRLQAINSVKVVTAGQVFADLDAGRRFA